MRVECFNRLFTGQSEKAETLRLRTELNLFDIKIFSEAKKRSISRVECIMIFKDNSRISSGNRKNCV